MYICIAQRSMLYIILFPDAGSNVGRELMPGMMVMPSRSSHRRRFGRRKPIRVPLGDETLSTSRNSGAYRIDASRVGDTIVFPDITDHYTNGNLPSLTSLQRGDKLVPRIDTAPAGKPTHVMELPEHFDMDMVSWRIKAKT